MFKPDLRTLFFAKSSMLEHKTAIPNRFCKTRNAYLRTLRLLNSASVTHECIFRALYKEGLPKLNQAIESSCEDLLFLYDTTTLNLNHLSSLLKVNDPKIGVLSDNRTLGMFMHVGLVVCSSPTHDIPLGLSYFNTFSRPFGRQKYKKVNPRSIETKETYEWINGMKQSVADFAHIDRRKIHISDRGSDVYVYLHEAIELKQDFVIRSKHKRKVVGQTHNLHNYVSQTPARSVLMEVTVSDGKRPARKTLMALKGFSLTLKCPEDRTGNHVIYPDIRTQVVHAQEISACVPSGEKPLEWILLTSLPIDTDEQIKYVVECYRKRWLIEELFKTLKSDEMKIENTYLQSSQAIENLAVIAVGAAVDALAMKKYREDEQTMASELLDEHSIEVIEHLVPELEGRTAAQKNPYKPYSAAWACWVVARLGGWKGYSKSEAKPGVKTFAAGLAILQERTRGWLMAKAIADKMNTSSRPDHSSNLDQKQQKKPA